MPLKVAIVGTAPTSRGQAPFSDSSWEIWGQAQPNLPRWTRWFELHDLGMIEAQYGELWDFLAKSEGERPIYVQAAAPRIKGAVVYPLSAVLDKFGPHFLTSTVAWEMALAISEGATDIALYGVEMAAETEYAAQKPGCQHFIALARQIGIRVTLPSGCELMNPQPLYVLGPDNWRMKNLAVKKDALVQEKERLAQQIMDVTKLFNQVIGSIEALEFVEQNWS